MNEIRLRELDEGPFKASVLEAVSLIPVGQVASYEDLAEAIGYPRDAGILVGWVIESVDDEDLPLHRVVRPDGTLPNRTKSHPIQQADMLGMEGIEILEGPRINLDLYRWHPMLQIRSRGPIYSTR